MDPRLFPKNFMWGASTSSHQVEGGTVNQWSEWELAQASELAQSASKRLSWLPDWRRIRDQAQNPANYVSGRGIEHFARYDEDFDLLEDLHLNSFRFGIEWSRIEPGEGVWDLDAIRHYHRYIDSLNKRGVEPVLNLWHWTMPPWFTAMGGFEKKANLVHFDQFVQKIVKEYGPKLRYIITLNEPNVYVASSYFVGEWPPQQKNVQTCLKVLLNLIRAHKRAYSIIKRSESAIRVGVAMNMGMSRPKSSRNPISPLVAYAANYGWNRWFLNRIRKQQDFIGINFYHTNYFQGFSQRNPTTPVSDLGWYMEPEAILPLLVQTHAHYKVPIIVTENGVADARDRYRRWWLEQTLIALQRALSQGVPLQGYFYWSLLDNFEWAYGWWPKFGLVGVDREHGMKREIRGSAKWFANYLAKLQNFQKVRAAAHGKYDD